MYPERTRRLHGIKNRSSWLRFVLYCAQLQIRQEARIGKIFFRCIFRLNRDYNNLLSPNGENMLPQPTPHILLPLLLPTKICCTPNCIPCPANDIPGSISSLASCVGNTTSCLPNNVSSTIGGLGHNISGPINCLCYGSSDSSEKSTLALFFVSSCEGIIESVR